MTISADQKVQIFNNPTAQEESGPITGSLTIVQAVADKETLQLDENLEPSLTDPERRQILDELTRQVGDTGSLTLQNGVDISVQRLSGQDQIIFGATENGQGLTFVYTDYSGDYKGGTSGQGTINTHDENDYEHRDKGNNYLILVRQELENANPSTDTPEAQTQN